MGLHIRHKSLCKLVLPSITKDIKYINKNKLLIYMIISVHNIYLGEIWNFVVIFDGGIIVQNYIWYLIGGF
jgi:hypothetical protein